MAFKVCFGRMAFKVCFGRMTFKVCFGRMVFKVSEWFLKCFRDFFRAGDVFF